MRLDRRSASVEVEFDGCCFESGLSGWTNLPKRSSGLAVKTV